MTPGGEYGRANAWLSEVDGWSELPSADGSWWAVLQAWTIASALHLLQLYCSWTHLRNETSDRSLYPWAFLEAFPGHSHNRKWNRFQSADISNHIPVDEQLST